MQLKRIPADSLGNKHQNRQLRPRNVDYLQNSINDIDQLQPILVQGGECILGFHRLKACQNLGIDALCLVYPDDISLDRIILMQMTENQARSGMNFIEIADNLAAFMRQTGETAAAAGRILRVPKSAVSAIQTCMDDNCLDPDVRMALANANIGFAKAYELTKLPKEQQKKLLHDILNGMTVAELKKFTQKPRKTAIQIKTPESYADLVAQLTEQAKKVKALEAQGIPFNLIWKVLG